MSGLTVLWSMAAGVCVTLALVHVAIWLGRRRAEPAHLVFALSCCGAGANALAELALMRASTIGDYAVALRCAYAATALLVIPMAWFVRGYFHNGRRSLAWAITVVWAAVALLAALLPFGPGFGEISRLHLVPTFWGESFAVAVGATSRWNLVTLFGDLLIAAFILDAATTLARLGQARRAAAMGGSVVVVLLAVLQARLVDAGVLHMPYVVTFVFLGIVVAVGYPLSADIVRVAELARRLEVSEAGRRESEERLRQAAEAANLNYWTWDATRDEVWVNADSRVRLGAPAEEHVALVHFLERVHPDDRGSVRRILESAVTAGGEFDCEYRVLGPGGELSWRSAHGAVLQRGATVLVRGVSLDITRRKRAELEAEERRLELLEVGRGTLMNQLAGSLAHEINQPLTAILSNAAAAEILVEREPIDRAELRLILREIQEDDARAGDAIWRVRELLRRGEPERELLDVNAVVEEVLRILRNDLAVRRVEVETLLAPGLPPVRADRVQLQQVLLNLILNGCDAMAEMPTGRRLAVSTEPGDSGAIRVSIADRGRGIAPALTEQIFEAFYGSKLGVGLGLAVSRAIVNDHGGRIWVAEPSGPGATLRFELPGEPAASLGPAERIASLEGAGGEGP